MLKHHEARKKQLPDSDVVCNQKRGTKKCARDTVPNRAKTERKTMAHTCEAAYLLAFCVTDTQLEGLPIASWCMQSNSTAAAAEKLLANTLG